MAGDLETLVDPQVYAEAIRGVRQVANCFLNVKQSKPTSPLPPDGNAILDVLGRFLFKAVNFKKKDGYY